VAERLNMLDFATAESRAEFERHGAGRALPPRHPLDVSKVDNRFKRPLSGDSGAHAKPDRRIGADARVREVVIGPSVPLDQARTIVLSPHHPSLSLTGRNGPAPRS
jgi:hypothetical protein